MNKVEFINKLDRSLNGISYEDKKEILYDYEEHFSIGLEQGKSEEDIAKSLGDPAVIARQFRLDYKIKRAETDKSAGNLVSALFASLGLGFLNLLLLPFYIAAASILFSLLAAAGSTIFALVVSAWSIVVSFFAVALSLVVGGVATFIAVFAAPYYPDFINIDINTGSVVFMSLGALFLGLLTFIGTYKFTIIFFKWNKTFLKLLWEGFIKCVKGFYTWSLKYIKMNVDLIKNKRGNEDA